LLSAFQNKEIDFFLGIVTHSSLCQAVIIKGIGTALACEVDCILWESANAIWVSESFECLAPRELFHWNRHSQTIDDQCPNQDVNWGFGLGSRQQHLLQMHAIKWRPLSELLYPVFFWSFLASSTVVVTEALLIQSLENGFGKSCWIWQFQPCSCFNHISRKNDCCVHRKELHLWFVSSSCNHLWPSVVQLGAKLLTVYARLCTFQNTDNRKYGDTSILVGYSPKFNWCFECMNTSEHE